MALCVFENRVCIICKGELPASIKNDHPRRKCSKEHGLITFINNCPHRGEPTGEIAKSRNCAFKEQEIHTCKIKDLCVRYGSCSHKHIESCDKCHEPRKLYKEASDG